jgi:hypothetical protein
VLLEVVGLEVKYNIISWDTVLFLILRTKLLLASGRSSFNHIICFIRSIKSSILRSVGAEGLPSHRISNSYAILPTAYTPWEWRPPYASCYLLRPPATSKSAVSLLNRFWSLICWPGRHFHRTRWCLQQVGESANWYIGVGHSLALRWWPRPPGILLNGL